MENQEFAPAPQPVKYAGFWLRFVAILIDGIIISFVESVIIIFFMLIMFVISASHYSFNSISNYPFNEECFSDYFNQSIIMGLFMVIGLMFLGAFLITIKWLYYALMESSKHQATIGKLALGLKVTDMNGQRISFARATGRYFGKIISGMILLIGYIMAGFTEKKQALHDIMANCLVVKR